MKILVWSDSHGHHGYVSRILDKEPECKTVFFLGDGMKEAKGAVKSYPDRKFFLVKGNNDDEGDDFAYAHIEGVTFMACHGDALMVDISLRDLYKKADSVMAKVALYGHTHKPNVRMDSYSGICAINPGALCEGEYCVIEVEKGDYIPRYKSIWGKE